MQGRRGKHGECLRSTCSSVSPQAEGRVHTGFPDEDVRSIRNGEMVKCVTSDKGASIYGDANRRIRGRGGRWLFWGAIVGYEAIRNACVHSHASQLAVRPWERISRDFSRGLKGHDLAIAIGPASAQGWISDDADMKKLLTCMTKKGMDNNGCLKVGSLPCKLAREVSYCQRGVGKSPQRHPP